MRSSLAAALATACVSLVATSSMAAASSPTPPAGGDADPASRAQATEIIESLSLSDVDCLSDQVCLAAGTHRYTERFEVPGDIDTHVSIKDRPLVVARSPNGWVEMDFPAIPQGHSESLFTAASAQEISCVPTARKVLLRTTYCVMSGRYEAYTAYANDVFEQGPMTAVWNGLRWRLVEKPTPLTLTTVERHDLDCVAAKKCYSLSRGPVPSYRLATWDGRKWGVRKIPGTSMRRSPSLLSCWATSRCLVVGYYEIAGQPRNYREFAALLSNRGWSSQPLPGKNNGLSGLACRGAKRCVAVGSDISLVGSASANDWLRVPMHGDTSHFIDVACPTASKCLAVGHTTADPPVQAVQRFEGNQWHDAGPPSPTSGLATGSASVDCTRVWSCFVASGGYGVPDDKILLAWNGRDWSYETVSAKPFASPPST